MHRHTKWLHRKGRLYADARNEQTKDYQRTDAGWIAMKTGRLNSSAKLRGARGKVGSLQLVALWARQNGIDLLGAVKCATCGTISEEWHADHITPLKDGGDHDARNIQLLCETCHRAKTKIDRDAYADQAELFS